MKINKIITYIDIPHHLASHVVGENHTPLHKKIAGAIVMLFGVWLAHAAAHFGNIIISLAGDLVGYSIHATGVLPWLHDLEEALKGQRKEPEHEKKDETKCLTC